MVKSPAEVGPPGPSEDDLSWQRKDLEELVDEILGRYEHLAEEYEVPLPLMYHKDVVKQLIRQYEDAGWSAVKVVRNGSGRLLKFRR